MTKRTTPSRSLWAFVLIWLGQLVSLIGSSLTSFALSVWAYQTTQSATPATLFILAAMGPNALLSLVVGPFIDRWDRRRTMILSDTGAGLSTLVIFLLLISGQNRLGPILLATAASSAFSAFQWPAYAAATTMLVPKEHLGRANGMVQLGQAVAYIASPAVAASLYQSIDIQGVILIDFTTFAFAVLTLLCVRIPQPRVIAQEEERGESSWLREFIYGLTYLSTRPGLVGLLILFAMLNFLLAFVMALFTPMVLSFADADTLGKMTSIGASGMLFGGVLMSIWGGPKRRIHGLLGFLLLAGLALTIAGLRPSVTLVTAAIFGFFFCFPIVSACSDALWQSKVAPQVQGRVFGARSTIATFSMVPGYAIAGPLADLVFEPLLAAGGPLSQSVGQVIGVGAGRGMGLIFVLAGLLTIVTTAGGYLHPRIRLVEDELPDAVPDEQPSSHEDTTCQGGDGSDSIRGRTDPDAARSPEEQVYAIRRSN